MLTVRRPRNTRAVVAQAFPSEEVGAVCEDDIVLRRAFLGCRRGGYDEDPAGAKMEQEDRAMALRDGGEGTVEGRLHEVEMAEDGDRRKGTGQEVAVISHINLRARGGRS